MLQKTAVTENETKEEERPLFSVGLIADPQYADSDNGQNFYKTRTRRYRQALSITQNAIKTWNDDKQCIIRPSLIMCLGDVIDLINVKNKTSVKAMNTIMMEFDKFKPFNPQKLLKNINIKQKQDTNNNDDDTEDKQDNDDDDDDNDPVPFGANAKYPFYHNCLGNHEVYNFDRKQMRKYQYCSEYIEENNEYRFYYSFYPFPGYLFIVLDGFVLSVHGYEYIDNKHKYYEIASDLLNKYNPNDNKNIPPISSDKTEIDVERYSAFNGGFGVEQLKWLENELEIAKKQNDKVFIFSHIPLISTNEKKPYEILAWDYKECKKIVDKYKDIVKVFFAGHDHDGDKKINGIIHRTFEGVIESDEKTDCFATGYFYKNKLVIKGYGKINDEIYPFQ